MKSANLIIEHIKTLPQFKIINQYYCCKRFISLLSPRFQKAIAFYYLKDDTIFLALSHPGFKMELYSKIDSLKSLLSMVRDLDEKCKNFKASNIVIFNSKLKSIIKKEKNIETVPHYQERALNGFNTDNIKDEDLKRAFERIKKIIDESN
jgi:hypothetical protein